MDLDRIAVLQKHGESQHLLVGTGEVADLDLVTQSTDVQDFDLEVRVTAGEDFTRSQRLAVVSTSSELLLGAGSDFPLVLAKSGYELVAKVQWAGERLALERGDGQLRLLHVDAMGQPKGFDDVPGRTEAFRLNAEGSLLVLSSGRIDEYRLHLPALNPAEQQVYGHDTPDALLSGGLLPLTDLSGFPANRTFSQDTAFELSSIRPLHARRAATLQDVSRVPADVRTGPVNFPAPWATPIKVKTIAQTAYSPSLLLRANWTMPIEVKTIAQERSSITVAQSAAGRVPVGYFDIVGCNTLACFDGEPYMTAGWGFDPDFPSQSIVVHFYVDGVFAGAVTANQYRGDVNAAYGITGNHGWQWRIPDQFVTGTQKRRITAYLLDTTWSSTNASSFPGNPTVAYYGRLLRTSQLTFPLGSTSYAEDFVRNYGSLGSNSVDVDAKTWWPYKGSFACSTGSTGQLCAHSCEASYAGKPSCDTFPAYKPSTAPECSTYPNNIDLIYRPINERDNVAKKSHVRAHISSGGATWFGFGPGTGNRVGYQNTSGGIAYLDFMLQVQDRIGRRPGSSAPADPDWGGRTCSGSSTTYPYTYRGPSHREVYPGELTPDGYGVVPSAPDTLTITGRPWVLTMRADRRFWPSSNNYGITGDAFFLNSSFQNAPAWGGDTGHIGPNCRPGTTCIDVAPRAKFNYLMGGGWSPLQAGVQAATWHRIYKTVLLTAITCMAAAHPAPLSMQLFKNCGNMILTLTQLRSTGTA